MVRRAGGDGPIVPPGGEQRSVSGPSKKPPSEARPVAETAPASVRGGGRRRRARLEHRPGETAHRQEKKAAAALHQRGVQASAGPLTRDAFRAATGVLASLAKTIASGKPEEKAAAIAEYEAVLEGVFNQLAAKGADAEGDFIKGLFKHLLQHNPEGADRIRVAVRREMPPPDAMGPAMQQELVDPMGTPKDAAMYAGMFGPQLPRLIPGAGRGG